MNELPQTPQTLNEIELTIKNANNTISDLLSEVRKANALLEKKLAESCKFNSLTVEEITSIQDFIKTKIAEYYLNSVNIDGLFTKKNYLITITPISDIKTIYEQAKDCKELGTYSNYAYTFINMVYKNAVITLTIQ